MKTNFSKDVPKRPIVYLVFYIDTNECLVDLDREESSNKTAHLHVDTRTTSDCFFTDIKRRTKVSKTQRREPDDEHSPAS